MEELSLRYLVGVGTAVKCHALLLLLAEDAVLLHVQSYLTRCAALFLCYDGLLLIDVYASKEQRGDKIKEAAEKETTEHLTMGTGSAPHVYHPYLYGVGRGDACADEVEQQGLPEGHCLALLPCPACKIECEEEHGHGEQHVVWHEGGKHHIGKTEEEQAEQSALHCR